MEIELHGVVAGYVITRLLLLAGFAFITYKILSRMQPLKAKLITKAMRETAARSDHS